MMGLDRILLFEDFLNHDKHLEVDETTRLDAKIPNSQVAS
jgi:hypothetical protein